MRSKNGLASTIGYLHLLFVVVTEELLESRTSIGICYCHSYIKTLLFNRSIVHLRIGVSIPSSTVVKDIW